MEAKTLASKRSASPLDEKHPLDDASEEAVKIDSRIDVAAGLVAGHDNDHISPEESRRLRAKIDWHLLPLLFFIYTVQYIDKGTLASSYVLGIVQDNHLTIDEWNTLGSAFYIGYLVFEYPQNWALQRFPAGKWMAFNILLWSVFLGLYCVCSNFGGLFVLRFLLGASEGCITAGLMLVTSMFYTRTEIAERIGWTFQCNGFGTIVSGFLSFGVAHISAQGKPAQWQWLMIITTILTLIVFVLFVLFFPDNPTTAKFLTSEERVKAVKRVEGNKNGIETKVWKRSQFMEALTDTKTWLFFLFAAVADLQNGIGVQYSRVIKSFGFTNLQTTVLNIPSGLTQIMGITLGCYLLRKFPNSRAWINIGFWMPSILAALLQICLPLSNKAGHLAGLYVFNFGGAPGFIMILVWVTATVSGHTKKLATNSIVLIGYALGQILCTQFWKDRYAPRYIVPWAITLATHFTDIAIVLAIRYVLVAENRRRDRLLVEAQAAGNVPPEMQDFGYVVKTDEKGYAVKVKVDKSLLDLTDKENLAFRYVL
ncbi:MFS general substrate transporter [Gloeophyllum trabeum ATCC 11539]|uniref:MFS general substrate transporter n=1 Tax=Gloeophyllum trabeum (strain ATCC 11539 / FP-39264 / Madison 617) TaxID=670483 RepID=S7PY00_GLOTA|nr:MFS general substrate transporter [Gloeophyllum trabeum ATCC 11539]EPQ52227.1 MFS general substrate transporter [Gloeophyllum trabeum ATCC 11539]